ncbi:MAG: hypothetical protein ACJ8FS_16555 [Sphingomicrobium sp.]
MGKHDAFSQSDKERIVDHVCDQIASYKRSLFRVLAEDDAMCGYSTFQRWMAESESFERQVARAREAALEALIDEMVDISKDPSLDHNTKRVQLIAIEKSAQMLAPRRFGQKLDVTSDGKALPAPIAIRSDRIEALLALAAQRKLAPPGELIDVTPEPSLDDLMS